MTATIALCVIADDNAIEDGFERMLRSAVDQVHGVYVTFTGTNDNVFEQISDVVFSVFGEGGIKGGIATMPWQDDFALARNHSFSLATGKSHLLSENELIDPDWLFWMDCDDTLDADLQDCISELATRRAHGGLMRYHYQLDDDGNPLVTHYKERLFRADVDWVWRYPVHENCVGPIATRMAKLEGGAILHHRVRRNTDRNRQIIKRWFDETQGHDPRALFFMAHATYDLALDMSEIDPRKTAALKAAIKLYRDYIEMSPPDDDSYICNSSVAHCLRLLGRFNDAINVDLQGVKMRPTWPSAYVGVAETYHAMEDYEQAIEWCQTCRKACDTPDSLSLPIDRLELAYRPLMIEGDCLMRLGRPSEAELRFTEALKHRSDEFTHKRVEEACRAAHQRHEIDDPQETRKMLWGTAEDRSIAFYTGYSAETWNPDSVEAGGIGGTELTVMRLAQEMAHNGWRVAIFGNPGEWDGKLDSKGVEWYRAGSFHPDEPFTVFVALRNPEILDAPIKAKVKVLWLHDVSMGDVRFEDGRDRFSAADAIVCPSPWHVQHIARTYRFDEDPPEASLYALFNGFDRDLFLFDEDAERNYGKVVYASSPDRGLPRLLDLWPRMQEAVDRPIQLDIYYGWESIDAIIAIGGVRAPMLAAFKEKTQGHIKKLISEGYAIHEHGRVNQWQLAQEFKAANVMAYPANFMETFGIVFVQAMAAGVIPIVPKLGNLPDLIVGHDTPEFESLVISGSPNNEDFAGRFIEAFQTHLIYGNLWMRRNLAARTEAADWPNVVRAWEQMIGRLVAGKTLNVLKGA